jgi:hypothetical protein
MNIEYTPPLSALVKQSALSVYLNYFIVLHFEPRISPNKIVQVTNNTHETYLYLKNNATII